jgi:hypothetical protein
MFQKDTVSYVHNHLTLKMYLAICSQYVSEISVFHNDVLLTINTCIHHQIQFNTFSFYSILCRNLCFYAIMFSNLKYLFVQIILDSIFTICFCMLKFLINAVKTIICFYKLNSSCSLSLPAHVYPALLYLRLYW